MYSTPRYIGTAASAAPGPPVMPRPPDVPGPFVASTPPVAPAMPVAEVPPRGDNTVQARPPPQHDPDAPPRPMLEVSPWVENPPWAQSVVMTPPSLDAVTRGVMEHQPPPEQQISIAPQRDGRPADADTVNPESRPIFRVPDDAEVRDVWAPDALDAKDAAALARTFTNDANDTRANDNPNHQNHPSVNNGTRWVLQNEILDCLKRDDRNTESHRRCSLDRIRNRVNEIFAGIGGKGFAKLFGSYVTNFCMAGSDLHISYFTHVSPELHWQDPWMRSQILSRFAAALPANEFGNVTRLLGTAIPSVKFTDSTSGMEADLCVDNDLWVRNSELLRAYSRCDDRVRQLGRLIKEWATKRELVGASDGLLDKYAYMLMVIHFLQTRQPPVVPNLQDMASESVTITDLSWGCEEIWETKFFDNVSDLPQSQNEDTASDLLVDFFQYYATFDWEFHAVCIRLSHPDIAIDKYRLSIPTITEQWYIEDPFDRWHNLAGHCSPVAQQKVMEEMRRAASVLSAGGGWIQACPEPQPITFYLKSHKPTGILPEDFNPEEILAAFRDCGLTRLHFPRPDSSGCMGPVYLVFPSNQQRRKAQAKSGISLGAYKLQLQCSSVHGLNEALNRFSGGYEVYLPSGERAIADVRWMM